MRNKVLNLKTFDLLNFHCLTHSALTGRTGVEGRGLVVNHWQLTSVLSPCPGVCPMLSSAAHKKP